MGRSPYGATIRAVPWKPWEALIAFFLPWVLLPVAVFLLLGLIGTNVPWIQHFFTALENNDPKAAFILVILDAVGSYAVLVYYLRKHLAKWRDLGFGGFSFWRAVGTVLLILIAFGFLVTAAYALIQLLYPGFNANQPQTNEFTGNNSSLSLWALVIIPPFVEEPIFRGFMFPAFAKRYGLVLGAMFSSVLFGFAHLQANVSVYTFILGLLLCWMYVRLGSIIPGIGLHMLNNYIAYMALNQK